MELTGAGSGWLADHIMEIGCLAFAALFATLACYLVWKAFHEMDESDRWPVVPGRIVASAVIEDGEGDPSPAIAYTWTVKGQTYRGDRIRLGAHGSWEANEICSRHPVGATVDVAYDPTDPSKACLARERTRGAWGLLILPLAGLVMFAVIALKLLSD